VDDIAAPAHLLRGDHVPPRGVQRPGFLAFLDSIFDTAIIKLGNGASSIKKKLNELHCANLLI
jgi:hypothetical protein